MDYFHGVGLDLTANRCDKLQAINYLNLTISILLLIGIFISYLPQHHRIISRRTSEGLSPFFVLLGVTSGTSGFANIVVLPASRADVACCKTVSTFECAAGLLGIAQVGTQWFCFVVILLLFLIFFPRPPTLPNNDIQKEYTWQTAVTVAFLCLLHGLVIIIVSVTLAISRPDYLGAWANSLGIMATILASIQYFPQIWMTWNLGHVGSLSIPMMCLQTPGGFLWSASLAARLGVEGWSTWGVYLVTASLQGFLLVMCICFEIRDMNQRQRTEGDSSNANARCIVGYIPSSCSETDDEGAAAVEDVQTESTPLLKKGPHTGQD